MLTAGLSSQERQRRYLSLSPWDKATLSLVRPKLRLRSLLNPHDLCRLILLFCVCQGRAILSNKIARTVAFFYTLFLHCLVFLVRQPPDEHLLLPHPLFKDLTRFSVILFQVLYKTAWSESIGRDCTAFCAKK